ncbi:PPC domain-containing protein [Scytonema sp. NUACC26]|uniref:PPC domain-containing protein n=1 Tax=Scytonema sp. NUACC26 TaxID=3140176 RepID=UPI0034DB9E96
MSVNLFNANFYRAANPDLAGFDNNQLHSHFQNYGLNEGRHFSPLIDLNFYRASNSDLANFNNSQAYEHLQNYGIQEGRKFSLLFDFNFYRTNNGDLVSLNNEQLFEHLQNYGLSEGREFSSFVNLNFYRSVNSDLSGFNNNQALQHFVNYGLEEGRRFSPFIDLNIYRAVNPDLLAVGFNNTQLLQHLETFGVTEGRRLSVSFNSNYYRNIHSDLIAVGFNNTQAFEHFQKYGLQEGRASSEFFNVSYYLANNSDLKALNFSNQQAQQHFEIFGFLENRLAVPSDSLSPSANRDDNTLGNAFNIGFLNSSRNFTNQFIGTNDRNDYYRLTLTQTSYFNLSLTGLSDYADIEVIFDANSNGVYDSNELLYDGFGSSNQQGSINTILGAGTYFIRIFCADSITNTNYTLGVSATAAPRTTPKEPGNTFETAVDVGVLNTKRSFTDFVGSSDRNDYYRFSLAQTSNFNLSLSGLSSYADVELIFDSNGNGIYDSNEKWYQSDGNPWRNGAINTILGAGTYFIRVYTADFIDNTNYTLEIING